MTCSSGVTVSNICRTVCRGGSSAARWPTSASRVHLMKTSVLEDKDSVPAISTLSTICRVLSSESPLKKFSHPERKSNS